MRKTLVFLISLSQFQTALACDNEKFYITRSENIKKVKSEINSINASNVEKATLAAIASIETENMRVDYSKCDGKFDSGCNIGIYKANISQLKFIDKTVNLTLFDNNTEYAHNVMLRGIRKMGFDEFLKRHRGGESIRGYTVDKYVCAIKQIASLYEVNGLNDNHRYTIKVDPI